MNDFMKRQYVDSTAMLSVGYNSKTHILEIEFPAHTIYDYLDVPEYKYTALMNAESKGEYYNKAIKPFHQYKLVKK